MARTNANSVGPAAPRGTAVNTIIEQLDNTIERAFRDFHNHSKECRGCRNPVLAYQESRDLCKTGRDLTVNITKLLYRKAEHVPQGTFTISFPRGWEAVDGLVRIITHYNQGHYENVIRDIKRFAPEPTPVQLRIEPSAAPYRGSGYEEDINRQRQAAERHRRRPSNGSHQAMYADPRTSFLDTNSLRPQGGVSPVSVSPASSSRSVHFDSHIHVREFDASP